MYWVYISDTTTVNMFDLDSYLAGVFDGEGCISAHVY
jgi:hypothetical protein